MFRSVFDDIKEMLKRGNMITRLIIINILVFVVIGVFVRYLFPSIYPTIINYFALSSDIWWNLRHPWVFITHIFLHAGMYHIFWNMLLYYWFGAIVGDLIGDKKILPLFVYGGLLGAIVYIISSYFVLSDSLLASKAVGASAAVMATVVAAGVIAPDYKVRLILIGPVSIKYIVIVLLIMDMIGTTGMNNTGGHFAHLGGALFGWFFVTNLKKGNDLSLGFNRVLEKLIAFFQGKKNGKSHLKVKRNPDKKRKGGGKGQKDESIQGRVDEILDKINKEGYEQLTDEEKEFLFMASKRQE